MAMRLSHAVIRSLYETLRWYSDHRGAPEAARVLQLFETWRGLHASFINISKEGWDALRKLAQNLQLQIKGRDDEWLFLFAVETYLNLAIRAITLAKLGRVANSIDNFARAVSGMRHVFESNVFERVFDALQSQTLDAGLRQRLQQNIDALLDVIASLNLLGVAFDALREVYQNVLPREVRRSIGEFYTSDKLVDETLDAAGLDDRAARELYKRWRQGKRDVVILDPACGSGSFLVAAIRRIFGTFGDKPPADIASFVEENVIGIDVNPFAVEMARLNVIATISEEMRKRGGAYVPQKVQIYWADSLARVRNSESLYYKSLKIDVPALQQAIGVGHIEVPHCGGVGPLEVLDEVVRLAERGGGLGELAESIAERCGVRPDLVRQDLERLYSAVRRILENGNGRVVAAIKNTLAVHDLLGRCSYVNREPAMGQNPQDRRWCTQVRHRELQLGREGLRLQSRVQADKSAVCMADRLLRRVRAEGSRVHARGGRAGVRNNVADREGHLCRQVEGGATEVHITQASGLQPLPDPAVSRRCQLPLGDCREEIPAATGPQGSRDGLQHRRRPQRLRTRARRAPALRRHQTPQREKVAVGSRAARGEERSAKDNCKRTAARRRLRGHEGRHDLAERTVHRHARGLRQGTWYRQATARGRAHCRCGGVPSAPVRPG
ncbi:MAG: N-6 DNA methylase [Thermoproteaceae archaeon]|nr:N-6 DNA methylase [Thermoproteaceae archaeon]